MSVSIYTETYVKGIEAQLAETKKALAETRTKCALRMDEARAQIKEQAKDAYFTQQRLTEERDEARAQIAQSNADFGEAIKQRTKAREQALELAAQIAAKDAALRKIADAPAWGYPDKWETTPAEVRQLAREALAAPARETE